MWVGGNVTNTLRNKKGEGIFFFFGSLRLLNIYIHILIFSNLGEDILRNTSI